MIVYKDGTLRMGNFAAYGDFTPNDFLCYSRYIIYLCTIKEIPYKNTFHCFLLCYMLVKR